MNAFYYNSIILTILSVLYNTYDRRNSKIFDTGEIIIAPVQDLFDNYDFIIVGAGSAGSTLAGRLSEISEWKILLLEAGGQENFISEIPAFHWFLRNCEMNWNYTTVKQTKACLAKGGICNYPRGRSLGGSSSINAMIYVRGNKFDYDKWKRKGNIGWSFKDVLPYFLKSENNSVFNYSKYHNKNGPLHIEYSAVAKNNLNQDFIKAGIELGLKWRDYNGKYQAGIDFVQLTTKNGIRWSTSKAFLRNKTSNLHVVDRAKVIKLNINPAEKTVSSVTFVKDNKIFTINCTKELILSAGAIDSAKILMLSGIGPKKILSDKGIETLADLPVGKNLQDHSMIILPFKINKTEHEFDFNNFTVNKNIINNYKNGKYNFLTSNGMDVVAFLNSENIKNNYPDVQFLISNDLNPTNESLIIIIVTILRPKSKGFIQIRSSNFNDDPLIDPNYYGDNRDLITTSNGLRNAFKLMKTSVMEKYRPTIFLENFPACEKFYDEDDITERFLNCLIINYSETIYHPVGTVKMGRKNDKTSVLNEELKVKTINGLRVIDASIMPNIISGNTNGPVIMIAEKGADLIKRKYGKL